MFKFFLIAENGYGYMLTRPNAMSSTGVVASSSVQASMVGANILRSGGNIVDAAIGTSAVLAVTQNNLCGLGGDMFALVRINGKGIMDYNASGRAGKFADPEVYRKLGHTSIPSRGELSAITVPGLVSGWKKLHDDFGTMEIRDLLRPAIDLARNGFPVTANYSESIRVSARFLSGYNWSQIFMPSGRSPLPGEIFRQADLASTLETLASEGLDTFYNGYLNDRIMKGLQNHNTLISAEDFARHTVTVGKPLFTDFMGTRVYETSPNSQGAAALVWLNILEEISNGGKNVLPEDMIRAGLISYEERARWITDPETLKMPSRIISREYAAELLSRNPETDRGRQNRDGGDTTYFTVADSDGNAISMIQSNYMGFGSGIVPDGTGFVMQNRGCYFTLNPEHHNVLRPGKRTFHTLCAAMVERDGNLLHSLGTMGGDIQPQVHIQIIHMLLRDGYDPQRTLDAPRWAVPFSIYEKPGQLIHESALDQAFLQGAGRVLPIKRIEGYSSQFGHAQIISIPGEGVVMGGADPRGDGIAVPVIP